MEKDYIAVGHVDAEGQGLNLTLSENLLLVNSLNILKSIEPTTTKIIMQMT